MFVNLIQMSGETNQNDGEVASIEKEEIKTKKPPKYKVLMHNDDYTSMEFVVHVLKRFFLKTQGEAESIMLKIHHEGLAVCGIFTHEVAESKTVKVNRYSRSKGHPLKCSVEPCEDEN
jgi:ATP-dependent Clp protease adaptor protein ClpS